MGSVLYMFNAVCRWVPMARASTGKCLGPVIITVFLMAISTGLRGESLRPMPGDVYNFFPAPDSPDTVVFNVEGLTDGVSVAYRIYNYTQELVDEGRTEVVDGRIDISIEVPQGYYEVHFPAFNQSFGLIALPDYPVGHEGYWCIDTGLTWSKWSPEMKVEMIRLLNNKGIRGFRERLSWPELDGKGRLNLEHANTSQVRDEVYCDNIGERRVLELFQDSPLYLRRDASNPFSIDLGRSYSSWQAIEERYGASWSALELWNEPFYVKGLPADQYVPVAKMAAAAASRSTVAGGCFSPSISVAYLDDCAEGGLLDVIDALTLHLYGSPESMPKLMRFYQEYLQRYGYQSLPVWVSESGDPESMGEFGRVSFASDRAGSMKTVMRAIECKVYGVKRFYTFYLQKHIEGVISWGMTDAWASPQRKLAAVLYAAQSVEDRPYLGDLNPMPAGVVFGHVFGDEEEAVVVIYAPGLDAVKLPFPAESLAGVDGRALTVNANQSIPVPDGIVYVRLPRERIEPFIDRECDGMKARPELAQEPHSRKIHTLVLQPEYIRNQTEQVSNLGYFLDSESARHYTAATYVSNLSDEVQQVRVSVDVPGIESEVREVSLAPLQSERVEWKLDLSPVMTMHERTPVTYHARSDTDVDTITVYVQPQPATRIYQVQRCEDAPRIDGNPSDACWELAEKTKRLDCLDNAPGGAAAERKGLDGVARFLWGDIGLYFLIEVEDEKQECPENASLSWQSDSVQIAFYQENSPQDINSFEWGFFRDRNGGSRRVLFRSSLGEPLSESTRVSVVRDEAEKRTIYEGVIAWLDLGSMKAINERVASRFRLSFIINDANGGSRRWLEWSPGIAKGKNPSDYPELILVDDEGHAGGAQALLSPDEDWEINIEGSVEVVEFNRVRAFSIDDKKGAGVSRTVQPVDMTRPLSLTFRLGVMDFSENNRTSFCFKAILWGEKDDEGYECWLSPDGKLFGGKTGFVLADHDGMLISLGNEDAALPPDGRLHKITLWVDPVTRILKLYVEVNGVNKLMAEGVSKRNIDDINRLAFTTSGWGSGDIILADVSLSQ